MKREDVINNLLATYRDCGVTREEVEELIRTGEERGFSYSMIYTGLRMSFGEHYGVSEVFTASEVAEILEVEPEDVNRIISNIIEERKAQGLSSDDMFVEVNNDDVIKITLPANYLTQ